MCVPPEVEPGTIIRIGNTPAVVCTVHAPGDIEVVYRDANKHAISEDAIWADDAWAFKVAGRTNGKFADKTPRLAEYVEILRDHHKPVVADFMTRLKEKDKKKPR